MVICSWTSLCFYSYSIVGAYSDYYKVICHVFINIYTHTREIMMVMHVRLWLLNRTWLIYMVFIYMWWFSLRWLFFRHKFKKGRPTHQKIFRLWKIFNSRCYKNFKFYIFLKFYLCCRLWSLGCDTNGST